MNRRSFVSLFVAAPAALVAARLPSILTSPRRRPFVGHITCVHHIADETGATLIRAGDWQMFVRGRSVTDEHVVTVNDREGWYDRHVWIDDTAVGEQRRPRQKAPYQDPASGLVFCRFEYERVYETDLRLVYSGKDLAYAAFRA